MKEEKEFEITLNKQEFQSTENSLWQELKNAIQGSEAFKKDLLNRK